MYPKSIQTLIDLFSRFPGIGPRTASRFVFYLLNAPASEVAELMQAFENLEKSVRQCAFCFNPFEAAENEQQNGLCAICRDATRDLTLLCVVEKESDLEQLEKIKQYHGRYFILGGVNDILKQDGLQNVRAQELKSRVTDEVKEVILALNPTTEGEATVLYLERLLKSSGRKVTRLGRGLPMGGELEYADDETLRSALEGRRQTV